VTKLGTNWGHYHRHFTGKLILFNFAMMELCYLTANLLKIIVIDAEFFKKHHLSSKNKKKANLLTFI
jgi:hypothetical protein